LIQVNLEGKRLYQTPSGENYPSVTTVMGWYNQDAIQSWRERVGAEEANKISARASRRGTSTHSLCENYLLGNHKQPSMFDQELFNSLIPHLDKINNIHCLESKLFSHTLKTAGTVDAIAEYDNQLCVIDFKTSSRMKERDDIHSYFMQASAYGYMFWELTGVLVKNICIIIGIDDHPAAVYIEPIKPWLQKFIEIRKTYDLFH
jgi:genome maintenance exonuclease 1